MTDEFTTPERLALAQLTVDFTSNAIVPNLEQWEDDGILPRSLHQDAASIGLLGIGYPEELGGSGGDIVDVTVMTEALVAAGASGGLFASLFSHGIAIPHVIDAVKAFRHSGRGDDAEWLISEFIRPVLEGQRIAALGVTEPDGGSDVAHIRTRAEATADGWQLNGAKTFITSGVRADVVVIAARADGPGAAGVALFAVDTSTPGFTVTRNLSKMGWQCSDTAELSLVDCVVPDGARLTPEPGGGFGSLARHFASERIGLATLAHSTAARSLELTLDWCRNRETFGQPLISRQAVRHQLVDMYRIIEVARQFTHKCVRELSTDPNILLNAVLAKNTAVDACDRVVAQAVQLHGGVGYMRGTEVERHYRDAKILGIGGGATEVMNDFAAKLLGW